MHILVIVLIAAVVLADQDVGFAFVLPEGWAWVVPMVAFLPPLVCLLFEMILIRRTVRDAAGGITSVIRRAGRRLRLIQWVAAVSSVIALIGLGWLELLRATVGDQVAIDELLAIIPALVLICLAWVVQWPLERLVREALVIRRLDHGLPVHPVPTRAAYVLVQIRSHLLIILVPALMVLTGVEIADWLVESSTSEETASWLGPLITAAVAIALIMLAPIGIIFAIGARPLAQGALRTSMETIIDAARVRVRNIMLWPTGNSILNGAVIGFVPPLRYVLLTDGLLETLSIGELRAVMAHEVGHLKYRHLPWTLAILLGLIWLSAQVFDWLVPPIYWALYDVGMDSQRAASGIQSVGTVLVLVITFVVFGWVSRRFERQADAAAVCELSPSEEDEESFVAGSMVTPRAAGLMCGALESVAVLNGLDPERNSWRHGSIRWRQKYLLRVIGQPIDRLQIDAQVRMIKMVTVITLAIFIVLSIIDVVI